MPTRAKGDAEAMAAGLAPGAFDRLAVAGGDGTLNEVVNGLARNRAASPLAVIPLGTANVLANEIGLAVKADAVACALMQGEARPVSLGDVNGRRFVLMAGVGLDAEVVASLPAALKRRLGRGAYVIETLRHIARGRSGRFLVRSGARGWEVESAVVANAGHYGGKWLIAPEAGLDRPDLILCRFERGGRAAAVGYALALIRGTLARSRGFATAPVRKLTIEGGPGAPVQADGDIVAHLPAEIAVLPAALSLVFPPR